MSHQCKYPRLPSDEAPAIYVSCGECGPAGKGKAHSPTSARGPGAHRGSSMLVGDDAGEGHPPTAQREFSPSITPSSRAAAGEEEPSRRRLNAGHSTWSVERFSMALGGPLKGKAFRVFVYSLLLLVASFAREQRRDRLHKRARSEEHTPSPFARMPARRAHPH